MNGRRWPDEAFLTRFAEEKLEMAAVFLSDEDTPLRPRLNAALVELLPVHPQHLPPDLREAFAYVRRMVGADHVPGEAGVVAGTTALSDDQARDLAARIAWLRSAVKSRLAS
jgi:hypothetical protein